MPAEIAAPTDPAAPAAPTISVTVAVLVVEITEHSLLARSVDRPGELPTSIDLEDIEAIDPPLETLQALPHNSRALLIIPQDLAAFAGFSLFTGTRETLLQEPPDHAPIADSTTPDAPALEALQDAPAPLAVAAVDAAAHVVDPGLPALTEHALQVEEVAELPGLPPLPRSPLSQSGLAETVPAPVAHALDDLAWRDAVDAEPAQDAPLQPMTHLEDGFPVGHQDEPQEAAPEEALEESPEEEAPAFPELEPLADAEPVDAEQADASESHDADDDEEDDPQLHDGPHTLHFEGATDLEVEHIFTRAELESMGQELAKLVVHIEDLEAEKKSHVDHYNSRIKVVEKDSTTLAHRIKRGKEMRTLSCYEVRNFDLNQMQYLERETREIIKRRPLTEEERQFPLHCKPIPEDGRIPQPAASVDDDGNAPASPPAFPIAPATSKGPELPPGWRHFTLELDDAAGGTLYVYDYAHDVQAEIAKDQAIVFSDLQTLEPGDTIHLALPEALALELGFLDRDAPDLPDLPNAPGFSDAPEADAHPAELEPATV